MKLLFVADGRSPIALNWIAYFVRGGHAVHLVSTFACSPDLPLASLQVVPVALSGMRGGEASGEQPQKASGSLGRFIPVRSRTALRRWLAPLTIPRASLRLRQIVTQIQPHLVHAMRIPFEGMLAGRALEGMPGMPLVVSVWGNDFTLHAPSTPSMGAYTRRTLQRADALHTDCQRDIRLAHHWGFAPGKTAFVLPGGGGIQMDVFYPPEEGEEGPGFRVINPRGVRSYIRNDTFFRAIPLIWQQAPEVQFVCPAMSGDRQAVQWVQALDISCGVELLPQMTRPQMAGLFRQAQVVVSPSEHDGTPNTLLEGMACGCFPIAGDIESVREWIAHGVNGLLFDPDSPQALAEAVMKARDEPELRRSAAAHNRQLIAERAEYWQVMRQAEQNYRMIRSAHAATG